MISFRKSVLKYSGLIAVNVCEYFRTHFIMKPGCQIVIGNACYRFDLKAFLVLLLDSS
jgi:hypothetical protein